MLLRAGEQQTGGAKSAGKWQSFSIRSVLGDALRDDDDQEDQEEDQDMVVEAARRLTPHHVDEPSSPTDLS